MRILVLTPLVALAACSSGPTSCPDGFFQDAGGNCIATGDDDDDDNGSGSGGNGTDDTGSTNDTGTGGGGGSTTPTQGDGKNTGDAQEGSTSSAGSAATTFYVVNASDSDICEMYISACNDTELGDNVLGTYILEPDWYYVVTGLESGCWDVWAWDCTETDLEDPTWEVNGNILDEEFTILLTE